MVSIDETLMSERELKEWIGLDAINLCHGLAFLVVQSVENIEVTRNINWTSSYGRSIKKKYDQLEAVVKGGKIVASFDGYDYWFDQRDFLIWVEEKDLIPDEEKLPMPKSPRKNTKSSSLIEEFQFSIRA